MCRHSRRMTDVRPATRFPPLRLTPRANLQLSHSAAIEPVRSGSGLLDRTRRGAGLRGDGQRARRASRQRRHSDAASRHRSARGFQREGWARLARIPRCVCARWSRARAEGEARAVFHGGARASREHRQPRGRPGASQGLRLDPRGRGRKARHQALVVREDCAAFERRRHHHHQHLGPFHHRHGGLASGGVAPALPRHAFLQSAALPPPARAGSARGHGSRFTRVHA